MSGHTSNQPARTPALDRRKVVQAAVWTVPAVTLVSGAPAFAASDPEYTITPLDPGTPPVIERCQSAETGLQFGAQVDGMPAPAGEAVTITLPVGLVFTGGSRTAVVTTDGTGTVTVPAFSATGAAGTYSISATWRGETASQTVTVVPAPGSVVQLNRQVASASATAGFTTTAVGITDAVAGAIYGDQSAANGYSSGATAAVLTDAGTVRYWGAGTNGTAATPATLAYSGSPLTGLALVDTWTSILAGNNTSGGVTAGTTGASVYSWYNSGSGAPVVAKVNGVSGTVLDVRAEDGVSYVLTTSGVYRWINATSGTTVAATLVSGTAGASQLSTYSHRTATSTIRAGGAAVVGSSVVTWSVNNSGVVSDIVTTTPPITGSVVQMVTSDSGTMLLTSTGELWSLAAAFGDGTTWKLRASDVASFSMWGYKADRPYVGGLWIDAAGQVTEFFGNNTWWTPQLIRTGNITSGAALTGITKTYSSDGTYMVLKSDGTVHAWGGNLDNGGRGPAAAIGTGAGLTVDLNVWGNHIGSYYGGGYVIKGTAGC
ncbi:MAG: hypothetical protein ACI379_02355 [Nocardioides sp.]|uniref:hypothetical protein n=1 Tax=Nocardioides sp. TaxID=35761 RepID=UPI003F088833